MKLENGNNSIEVMLDDARSWDVGNWFFSQNGWQRIGINISVEQFDMMKEIVVNPEVVEFYERLRGEMK